MRIKSFHFLIYGFLKLMFLAVIITCILISFFNSSVLLKYLSVCIFHRLTGFYCPLCGITRSLTLGINGKLIKAFSHNSLFYILLVYVLILLLYHYFIKKQKSNNKILFTKIHITIIISLTGLFWILRNLPLFPFSYLAP